MELECRVRLTRYQNDFCESPALYRAFCGGRGAGKSWVGAFDLLARARPGRLYLVASPTYTVLSDTTFRTVVQLGRRLGLVSPGDVKKSPPSLRTATGAEIIFRSADDPEKLRGPNLSGAWLDEASLMAREAYDIVIACLREEGEQGWLSATFTPKGRLHWTYEVFGSGRPDTLLTRARTSDNPFNPASFADVLRRQYGSLLAAQELEGEFLDGGGLLFRRQWFELVDAAPADLKRVRAWDLAATDAKKAADPDWTAGVLLGRSKEGVYHVLDVRRTRAAPGGVEALVRQTAALDGRAVEVSMEQEPGSAGVTVIDHYLRRVLQGHNFRGVKATGPKEVRAQPLAAMAEAGNVKLVRAEWNKDLLDELEVFPLGAHDDQVDAAALAFSRLTMPRQLHVFA